MHYLDNAATTRVLPEAAEAAVHAMCEEFGNPSSLHRMGLEASHLLEDSRRTVASALGCLPEEVYFTACGTESTNISLRGAAHLNRHKKGRIITTEIEHAATVNTAKQLAADGFDVVFLAPDATGHITPEVLSEAPFFSPASWSTTRSARYSRSNSSESCSRPRHPRRCSILMPYRVFAVYA